MNKKISVGITISLVAIAAALTFILTSAFSLRTFNAKVAEVTDMAEKYQRLDAMDAYVRQNYYNDIDENKLLNGILKGYVSGLGDPYASYMTPEEYQESTNREKGIVTGIGISVTQDESGYMLIAEITENSPAATAELVVGDLIIQVDGTDVREIGYTEAVNRVKGTAGTSLKLTIRRDGVDKEFSFVRQEIELTSAWGEMLENNVGYIRITAFREATVAQYQAALDKLVTDGASALIFDLRDNGGGLVTSAEACLDPLLPAGDVAYAMFHDGTTQVLVTSDEAELNLPMVVLVNGSTASAAELFASALRDFQKAQLYGVTTFGKGIMQQTIPLDDGGGLTLTVAQYRTVNSECYHGVGLTPDVIVEDVADDAAEADEQLDAALAGLLTAPSH